MSDIQISTTVEDYDPHTTHTILTIEHAGMTGEVMANVDQDSKFFEAWVGDRFGEPHYTLEDAVNDLLMMLQNKDLGVTPTIPGTEHSV